jgi:cell division protein FtsL
VRRPTRFVALWTLAVVATACSFILYLALRSRAVELGYKLGKARAKQSQLRETRRVLQVEAVAYRNPERIDALARGVLQMEEPPPQRTFVVGAALEPTEAPVAAKASATPTAASTSTISEHVEAPVLPNAAGVQAP